MYYYLVHAALKIDWLLAATLSTSLHINFHLNFCPSQFLWAKKFLAKESCDDLESGMIGGFEFLKILFFPVCDENILLD